MPTVHLQPELLQRLSDKIQKPKQRLREQISRRAGKRGISSAAALILWAKDEGIGVARFLNKLPAEIRAEIRSASSTATPSSTTGTPRGRRVHAYTKREHALTGPAIDSLLQDTQLRGRCRDLLLAGKHFDRVFREATTVLDDRLKTKSGITNMNPASLVGKVLNPEPQRAVLVVSQDRNEQDGFHAICRGIMLVFRNPAHHSLSDKFSREDALKFCGFIDTILGAVDQAEVHPERV
jgi:uncharacterized protein (TIGR02391 family)